MFRKAEFLTSAQRLQDAPPDRGAEVAFAGRSNAGKSSAINRLTGIRGLARTSKTPGRTQLLNFFTLDGKRRLVDLPGYGFARAPLKVRQRWQRAMEGYLSQRLSLRGLVVLMDARHPLKETDWILLEWCHAAQLATHLLLTKSDKLKRGPATAALLGVRCQMKEKGYACSAQLFSSLKGDGVEELERLLSGWLERVD